MSVPTVPLAASWATWMKVGEVAATAPMVIGLRLLGMAQASTPPSARDRREFTRMGQEKLDAWQEAMVATNQRLLAANLAVTGVVWRQLWSGALSPAALTAPLVGVGPQLLAAGVTPVHRRVKANNRRLSRSR